MGFVGVSLCDLCGKRTDNFPYQLVLFRDYKRPYPSKRTVWSKRICENCGRKVMATKTTADEIKEEIELNIDKLRLQKKGIKLLNMD